MAQNDEIRNKLVDYLEMAYAMENHISEVLEKQVQSTAKFPDIQARIQQHLDETKMHRTRTEERLKAYGKSPSGMKSALSNLLGNMQGAMSGVRSDELAMSARDDYATEHLEIGTYGLITAIAQLAGDQDTIQACELNLRDEIRMARWLEDHIGQAIVFTFQEEGISLPVELVSNIQQTVQMGMTSARAAADMPSDQAQTYTSPQI